MMRPRCGCGGRGAAAVIILLRLAAALTGASDAATCAGAACGWSDDETAHSAPRVRLPHGGRLLVLYQYYEAPKAAENLRYFLDVAVLGPAHRRAQTHAGSASGGDSAHHDALAEGVDYVFIITGHECSVPLPEGPSFPHVRILSIDNAGGWGFGAWGNALRVLGLSAAEEDEEAAGLGERPSGTEDTDGRGGGADDDAEWTEEGVMSSKYGAFAFINSSCRQAPCGFPCARHEDCIQSHVSRGTVSVPRAACRVPRAACRVSRAA